MLYPTESGRSIQKRAESLLEAAQTGADPEGSTRAPHPKALFSSLRTKAGPGQLNWHTVKTENGLGLRHAHFWTRCELDSQLLRQLDPYRY